MKVQIKTSIEQTEEREVELPAYFSAYDSVEASWWESEIRISADGEVYSVTKRGNGSATDTYEAEIRRHEVGRALGEYIGSDYFSPSTKEAFDAMRLAFRKMLEE